MYKLGFIGCGNMGRAMAYGAVKEGFAQASEVSFFDLNKENVEKLEADGFVYKEENEDVARESEIVILAVKPDLYPRVMDDIRPCLDEKKIILSITPAYSLRSLREQLGSDVKIVRGMPNTPSLVGQGMMGVAFDHFFEEADKEKVYGFLKSFGKVIEVKEDHMVGVGSVSGSAPAFIYMLIEAMADAAVSYGIPRKDAYTFAAQTVKGSAEMVLETGLHPGELKDQVTSPGGTTIAGCKALEEVGFRAAIMAGMDASAKRFLEMEEETQNKK